MSAVSDTINVIAAVIERDGTFLVCQRPPHKRHGGLWEFPGGKLEPGEGYLEAATRELHEELGLKVLSIGDTRFKMGDAGSHFMINFIDVAVDGEVQLLEHTAVAWLNPTELKRLPLAPSDEQFVRFLNGEGN